MSGPCAGCRLNQNLPSIHHLGINGCKRTANDTDESIFCKYGAVPFLTPIRLKLAKRQLYEEYGPLPFFVNKRTPPDKNVEKPEWLKEYLCIEEEINTMYFERLHMPKKKQVFKRLDEIAEEDEMSSSEEEPDESSSESDDSSEYSDESEAESCVSSLDNDNKERMSQLFDRAMLNLGFEFKHKGTINPFLEENEDQKSFF